MKTYLNQISGIDDAIVSMFMSKRSWTREKELHIRDICRTVLRPGGLLRLKTDNRGLFDYSLEQFAACGMTVEWQTTDLHRSERAQDNIMTEYERAFAGQGLPICSAWVRFGKEGTKP